MNETSSRGFARVHWPENMIEGGRRDWAWNPVSALRPTKLFQFQNGFGLNTKAMREALTVIRGQLKNRKQKANMKTKEAIKTRKVVKLSKKARRLAALKAWETIRANRAAAEKAVKAKGKANGKNGTKPAITLAKAA